MRKQNHVLALPGAGRTILPGMVPARADMPLMGSSAFFASMNENLIDFPPWRKNGRTLEDVALLSKDLVLPAQPLQLGRDIFRAGLGRLIDQAVPTATDPAHQRRKPDPKIVGDFALSAPTCLNQPNGLGFKLFRKSSLLHRGLLVLQWELSTFPKQVHRSTAPLDRTAR